MDSDKTLSNEELELTQKIQMHFPRGVIPSDVLKKWNGCKKEVLTEFLTEAFGKEPKKQLLEFLGNINIPANPEKFIFNNYFKVNISDDAPVKISGLGSNLQKWFSGMVEDPSDAMTLRKSNLQKASVDGPVIAESGGHDQVAATWFAILHLMVTGQLDKKRWHVIYVEDKVRSKDDEAIAYVNAKDKKVVLRAVRVFWDGDGWDLEAGSVLSPYEWLEGSQFFSRNSNNSETQIQ